MESDVNYRNCGIIVEKIYFLHMTENLKIRLVTNYPATQTHRTAHSCWDSPRKLTIWKIIVFEARHSLIVRAFCVIEIKIFLVIHSRSRMRFSARGERRKRKTIDVLLLQVARRFAHTAFSVQFLTQLSRETNEPSNSSEIPSSLN